MSTNTGNRNAKSLPADNQSGAKLSVQHKYWGCETDDRLGKFRMRLPGSGDTGKQASGQKSVSLRDKNAEVPNRTSLSVRSQEEGTLWNEQI